MVTITLNINNKQDAKFLLIMIRHCVQCREFNHLTSIEMVKKIIDLHDRVQEAIKNAK